MKYYISLWLWVKCGHSKQAFSVLLIVKKSCGQTMFDIAEADFEVEGLKFCRPLVCEDPLQVHWKIWNTSAWSQQLNYVTRLLACFIQFQNTLTLLRNRSKSRFILQGTTLQSRTFLNSNQHAKFQVTNQKDEYISEHQLSIFTSIFVQWLTVMT